MTDPLPQRVQAAVRDALATTSQNTSAGLDVSADLITSAVLAEVHRQHAAAEPTVDHDTDDVRDQLLDAIDFNYVVGVLGYSTPEELLAKYDASQKPAARAAVYAEAARTATETAARLRAEGHTTRALGAEDVADLLHAAARQETAAPDAAPWPPVTVYTVEIWDTDTWVGASRKCGTPDEARERRDAARRRLPNGRFRIVRWDETSTVMETDPEPTQP